VNEGNRSAQGLIELIYGKIILIYCRKTEFNPTFEVQNIENGMFQNAPFENLDLSLLGTF